MQRKFLQKTSNFCKVLINAHSLSKLRDQPENNLSVVQKSVLRQLKIVIVNTILNSMKNIEPKCVRYTN
jgi:hypothetical protein